MARRAHRQCGRISRRDGHAVDDARARFWPHQHRDRSPKATVFIDGRRIGQTPLVVELTAGTHHVVIRKEGYRPIEREIFADPSEPEANYDFALEPAIPPEASGDRQERIRQLKRLVEEALRRGDYVAPENANALYYLNQLRRLAPDDPFVSEMRERIRHILRQQAETSRRRRHLS